MATILEGLNAISQAVGGAGEAESNLEALNQISEALGGSADATENAEAIANIAENASGGAKPSGTININANGLHDVAAFEAANVKVPASAVVSGTVKIVQNGTVDVTNYAKANVNVPSFQYGTLTIENNLGVTILVLDMDTNGMYGTETVVNSVAIASGSKGQIRLPVGKTSPSSTTNTLQGIVAIRTAASTVIPAFSVAPSSTFPKAYVSSNYASGKMDDHHAYICINSATNSSGKESVDGGIVLNLAS